MVKSLKPATGQDLEIEKPIACRHLPTLDFHSTFAAVNRPPLIRNQVRQNRKTIEENSLATGFVMKALHHEQFPVDGIMKLIDLSRGFGNVAIRKQNMPPRLFPLYPFPHPLSIVFSCQAFNLLDESSQSLRKRPVVRGFASAADEKDLPFCPESFWRTALVTSLIWLGNLIVAPLRGIKKREGSNWLIWQRGTVVVDSFGCCRIHQ